MYDEEDERVRFEAIVGHLDDPEWLRLRRLLLVAGVVIFAAGGLLLAVGAGLGWLGVAAFAGTFVPGLLLVTHIQHGRFRRHVF